MGFNGNLNTQHTKKTTFVVVDALGNMPLISPLSLFTHLFMRHKKAPFMRNDPTTFPTFYEYCMRAFDIET